MKILLWVLHLWWHSMKRMSLPCSLGQWPSSLCFHQLGSFSEKQRFFQQQFLPVKYCALVTKMRRIHKSISFLIEISGWCLQWELRCQWQFQFWQQESSRSLGNIACWVKEGSLLSPNAQSVVNNAKSQRWVKLIDLSFVYMKFIASCLSLIHIWRCRRRG